MSKKLMEEDVLREMEKSALQEKSVDKKRIENCMTVFNMTP